MTKEDNAAIEALEKKVELLENIVESLIERFEASEAAKTALSATVVTEPVERPKIPDDIFVVAKQKYQFKTAGLHIEGRKVLATEALEDEKLLAFIVENYPQSIKKL